MNENDQKGGGRHLWKISWKRNVGHNLKKKNVFLSELKNGKNYPSLLTINRSFVSGCNTNKIMFQISFVSEHAAISQFFFYKLLKLSFL